MGKQLERSNRGGDRSPGADYRDSCSYTAFSGGFCRCRVVPLSYNRRSLRELDTRRDVGFVLWIASKREVAGGEVTVWGRLSPLIPPRELEFDEDPNSSVSTCVINTAAAASGMRIRFRFGEA